ncbi:MAG: hypothetical protein HXX10_17140 [Rhodoplanes sp.]|uniref:hypothetical protein n=1 Tax=Rhodoplanes sp. TaxID=1968906 RepID=UPI0018481B34|nr:hypothetical protein [Rhodoplanes sp.]NVO15760.1 hypothetical protein [Rhodoplanes sp.]
MDSQAHLEHSTETDKPHPLAPEQAPPRVHAAIDRTANAGSEMIGQNTAMAQRLLVAGAEMTLQVNSCARANLDLVTRSNAELMEAMWSASQDWSRCTRGYVEYIMGERLNAFLRHRTPQHLAVFQADMFHTGVAAALDYVRMGTAGVDPQATRSAGALDRSAP